MSSFIELINSDPFAIKTIPKEELTQELCEYAVTKSPDVLRCIPDEFKTYEMCIQAVKEYYKCWDHVPEKFRKAQIVFETIKDNNKMIKLIDKKYLTPNVQVAFVRYQLRKKTKNETNYLNDTPVNKLDPECILDALKAPQLALVHFLPGKFFKEELVLMLVKAGCSIAYIPEISITRDVCIEYFKHPGAEFSYIPRSLLDYKMCMDLIPISTSGYALNSVPEEFRTEELCWAAAMVSSKALAYVPAKIAKGKKFENRVRAEYKIQKEKSQETILGFDIFDEHNLSKLLFEYYYRDPTKH